MTVSGDLERVISGGFCIGCGACAVMDRDISIGFDKIGRLQARLPEGRSPDARADTVCPFTGAGPDEDALSTALYTAPDVVKDARLGRYVGCFAGWVEEDDLRMRGSSGGIGTWLQRELLRRGLVDAVLNVMPRNERGDTPLFSFTIARSPDEVTGNAKTRYYPVEMSGVIAHVIANPSRYAAIGTPCFAKALRLTARHSPELTDRLQYVIGIVCGHMKTATFAQALAWQCGIDPDGVRDIDFRAKLEGRPASRYGVAVTGRSLRGNGVETVTRPMEGLTGANWGHGLFKYEACEFCDDVLAETADVVVGDAWLPGYDRDHRGANVVVVRRPDLLTLLADARDAGRLHLDDLSTDDVATSQAGGLRHRRDGLAYRLWTADRQGRWRPRKRVAPGRRHLAPSMRRMHAARYALGQASHSAWRAALAARDFAVFERRMGPMIKAYDRITKPGVVRRALQLVERKIDSVLFRLGLLR